jgi:hypothetical protein
VGPIGPYGTNEGDIWLTEGSDVQERLDAEGKGMKLVHEIIEGKEKIYVTDDSELIARARVGSLRMGQPTEWTSDLGIDRITFPGYWPPGTPEVVREFLRTRYDPQTMPPLQVNLTKDGEYHLMGWQPGPDGIGLLEAARGYGLTEEESFYATVIWPAVEDGNLVLCPRCNESYFIPYEKTGQDALYEAGFFPPALSRMTRGEQDDKLYVCSACGQDEAMRDFTGSPPVPPDEWPINRRRGFGLGQNTPKGVIEWPDSQQ